MKCRTGCQGHQNSSWTVISQNVSCLAAADFQRWKTSSEWRALACSWLLPPESHYTQTEFTCSYCSSYGLACTMVARDGGTADVSKVYKVTLTIAVLQRVLHSLHESCMILHISCLHGLSNLAIILSRGGRAFRKECDTCIFF